MMTKHKPFLSLILACSLSPFYASADDSDSSQIKPNIYLNENIGFNVSGYKYTQSEFPCDIDKVLIKNLMAYSGDESLSIKTIKTAKEVKSVKGPILAIDVEEVHFGSQEHSYGSKNKTTLPSVKVLTALITDPFTGEMVTAKHSCAIMTLKDLNPSANNLLDMGTYGVTVCGATHKCLKDLSKDIMHWVKPQVKSPQ